MVALKSQGVLRVPPDPNAPMKSDTVLVLIGTADARAPVHGAFSELGDTNWEGEEGTFFRKFPPPPSKPPSFSLKDF